jgi:hypothetical protein
VLSSEALDAILKGIVAEVRAAADNNARGLAARM